MTKRTWVISGATSIIAKHFAHLVAASGHSLRLLGRDEVQLQLMAQDIRLRHRVSCEVLIIDMDRATGRLADVFDPIAGEFYLFIAHSDFTDNNQINDESIKKIVNINILATVQLINAYLNIPQNAHRLVYLSSVAACRGRAKNSLYGASKAAIEVYLQGLQQSAPATQTLTIARLGFIDTRQTYGLPGVFYAAPPKQCAKACLRAMHKNKRLFYYPGFWRYIMLAITHLPFFIFKRVKN